MRHVVVDNRGVAADIKLAQVLVAPSDEANAVAWLRESVVNSFVMIETDTHGDSFVYRSPDAVFVNGELSRRAYDFHGAQMMYLGEVTPGARRVETKTTVVKKSPPPPKRASSHHRRR